MKLAQSGSPDATGRKKSADAEPRLGALAREREPRPLASFGSRPSKMTRSLPVGVGGEVAPGHLGHEELLLLRPWPAARGEPARTRSLNSASFSPSSGRKPHWLRKSAVSFRYSAMSSRAMPRATRLPRNGGSNTGLSVATSGERSGSRSPRARASSAAWRRSSLLRGPRSRPPRVGPELRVVLAAASRARPAGPWCGGPRRRPSRRRAGPRRPARRSRST